ncbi:MAG: TonB family protein [Bacteroidota bacterium]
MRCITIFLFLVSFAVTAQVRVKLSYDKYWQLTTPDAAKYIRVAFYDTAKLCFVGPVVDLYTSGRQQMTGKYVDGKKQDMFSFYYEDGTVESNGVFDKDNRIGYWNYFYPNGKVKMKVEFLPGSGYAKLIFLKNEYGESLVDEGTGHWEEIIENNGQKIVVMGDFKDYRRDGKWVVRDFENRKDFEYMFVNGKLQANTDAPPSPLPLFPLPQKFIITEAFATAKDVDFKTYPILRIIALGNERLLNKIPGVVAKAKFDEDPNLFLRYINDNIRYPAHARRSGIQGTVLIEFNINENGVPDNFHVAKSIGGGCDEEALRLIKGYYERKVWYPAMTNNQPVKQTTTVPLKFSLE